MVRWQIADPLQVARPVWERSHMLAIRLLVTLAILVPVWVIRQPQTTLETFVIAVIAFGAGHLVEALVKSRRKPTPKQD
jgi:hypothetical protein